MYKIITSFVFFLLLSSFTCQSQTVVYSGRYGYDALAHIDDDVIYKGRYGYEALVHIDDGVIYSGRYGYDAIAHIDDGVIYNDRYGYDAIAHIDGYISDMQLYAVLILILDFE